MVDQAENIRKNLENVRERIAEAALRSGRAPADVRLVAVSKTLPAEAVLAAWACGQRDFGENRPEEGAMKIPQVAAALGEAQPVWHCIGAIQRRKVKLVVEHFDMIHAVERRALAEKLSRAAVEAGRVLPVLLECNISGEASKSGYALEGWERDPAVLHAFYAEVEALLALPALRVEGLMTMAPLSDDSETARPVFTALRRLLEALCARFPVAPWRHLSMGMTDDFEVAVEEGATLVRVGRGIFGARII